MIQTLFLTLFEDIKLFFDFLFVRSTQRIWRSFFDKSERINRRFGIKLNVRHFFEPLYQDYSLAAYAFSVPWKIILVLTGILNLALSFIFYLALWLFILSLPIVISLFIYHGATF